MKKLHARHGLLSALLFAAILLGSRPAFGADLFPGNPPITPYWALGHWVWEDMQNTQTSTVQLVKDYTTNSIPVCGVIVDSPWETTFNTFVPATSRYPNFAQMIADFHKAGVGTIAWAVAYINTDSPDYASAKSNGYVVDAAAGNITWWKGTGVHIDHTNPAAQAWLDGKMDNVLKMGLYGWKLDMGPDYLKSTSATVTLSAGSTAGTTMPLADFQKYYYQTIYDHVIASNPAGVITARGYAGTPGGTENKSPISRDPLCWQGDFAGDFSGIVSQAGMVYQTAINGYGCPGVEIGGYSGASPSKNSLLRYAQFGALSCYMENGGSNGGLTNHLAWYWDTQATDVYRYFATLHSELAPYNFSGVVDSHLQGGSVMKSCDKSNFTHKLGNDIFVGLITSDVTTRNITFPGSDKWIDYWNENAANAIYAGGTTKSGYSATIDKFPIFIRAGAIIPMDVKTDVTSHGDATSFGKITVLLYPYGTSSLGFHRPTGTGVAYEDVTVTVNEAAGTVTVSGPTAVDYRLRIKAFAAPAAVLGATSYSYDATNKVLVVDKTSAASFTITISGLTGYSSLLGSAPPPGTGGSSGSGGAGGSGGAPGTGGRTGSGGVTSSGGTGGIGGSNGSGGTGGSGGALGTGGRAGSGGATNSGGAGGATPAGGAVASGGALGTGGRTGSGGVTNPGGTGGTGSSLTGAGGVIGTGGTTGAGGAIGTGGTTGAGGALTGAGGAAGNGGAAEGAPGAAGTVESGGSTGQGGSAGFGGSSTSSAKGNSSGGCGCNLGGPSGTPRLGLLFAVLAIARLVVRRRRLGQKSR
jgi:hypothetical protein